MNTGFASKIRGLAADYNAAARALRPRRARIEIGELGGRHLKRFCIQCTAPGRRE